MLSSTPDNKLVFLLPDLGYMLLSESLYIAILLSLGLLNCIKFYIVEGLLVWNMPDQTSAYSKRTEGLTGKVLSKKLQVILSVREAFFEVDI